MIDPLRERLEALIAEWRGTATALRAEYHGTLDGEARVYEAIADGIEATLRAVPVGEDAVDAALVLRTCEVIGGVLAFAMGRTWGEGHKYWAARFDEANEAISQLRQATLRAVPAHERLAERLQGLPRYAGNGVYEPIEPQKVYVYLNDVLAVLEEYGLYPPAARRQRRRAR